MKDNASRVIRHLSRSTKAALHLLGAEVSVMRKQKGWSEQELATRAGVSRASLRAVEKGEATVQVGIAFEVAITVGLPLFGGEDAMARQWQHETERLALLPQRMRARSAGQVNDDF
ncbi:hypothetical protein AD953_06890 [Acetobacter malorum]|uniref:HTH cro/C1-type domain-containing protein n=1 Tax=Acetobacter malorum TaxID=178901 RepID=A0A149V5Q5_9PROT|nr:helix-turn-helix domain-containing protein [Acetobacter malorum]KXV75570.1 hypothetical protein AD953_06890 [Acetobacter malorum]